MRACVYDKGQERLMRNGDGFAANPRIKVNAADAAYTVTVTDIAGGILQATSLSAGRTFTTPTAAAIIAAFPEMDIGDCMVFKVSAVAAFAITWAAGTDVTLAGRATTPASTSTDIVIEKTAATTVKWTVL